MQPPVGQAIAQDESEDGYLDRSEPDNPSSLAQRTDAPEGPSSRRVWWQLASPLVAIAVLAAVGLTGCTLATSQASDSAGLSAPATGSAVASGSAIPLGPDAIPTQIDGQRVYRIGDRADWQNLGDGFLLAAKAPFGAPSCPAPMPTSGATNRAEADLLGSCPAVVLMNTSGSGTPSGNSGIGTAPKGLPGSAIFGWGGHSVVVRVHTHDPEASQCGDNVRAACEAEVVVEAVLWPVVPTDIAGERVYRAADQASFAGIKGSFLLGGLVTYPDVVPSCPSAAGPPGDGQGLLPYCYWPSIDGLAISPKDSFNEPGNEIVVARVHVNDPLAAECQPTVVAECQAAIVVESVVWTSNPYGAASSSSRSAAASVTGNPVSIPDIGPPVTPVSSDAAASIAIGQAGSTIPVTVLSTKLSTYGAEAGAGSMVAANTLVWAVRLSGSFQWPSCGPMTATPHPCPSPATSELILIDARTGAFIEGMMPAPSPS